MCELKPSGFQKENVLLNGQKNYYLHTSFYPTLAYCSSIKISSAISIIFILMIEREYSIFHNGKAYDESCAQVKKQSLNLEKAAVVILL